MANGKVAADEAGAPARLAPPPPRGAPPAPVPAAPPAHGADGEEQAGAGGLAGAGDQHAGTDLNHGHGAEGLNPDDSEEEELDPIERHEVRCA
jgi:hypothetical protein